MIMYPDSEIYQYLEKIHTIIEHQNKQIEKLEQEVQKLKSEIHIIKDQRPVGKIVYKFDQLKVERLEGTLNIGVTPNTSGSIEEFSVEGNVQEDITIPVENNNTGLMQKIKKNLEHYLDNGAKAEIRELEKKHNYPLDSTYQQLIIDDIKKQLDKQIQIYLNSEDVNSEKLIEVENNVVNKIEKDINKAIEAFILHLPKREND